MTEPNSNILPTDPLDTRSIGFSFCFIFFLSFLISTALVLVVWAVGRAQREQSCSHTATKKLRIVKFLFLQKKMLKMATGVPARLCPARCSVGFGRAGATGNRGDEQKTDERHMVTLEAN